MDEPAAARSWRGVLTLGPMVSVFSGHGGDTGLHRHPAHKIIIGARGVVMRDGARDGACVVVSASILHRVVAGERPLLITYLDARRYRLVDAERLAHGFRAVVPSHDAGESLLDDALRVPRRRLDARIGRILDALSEGATVREAARRVGLSESRATHLVSETLGAPPRSFRTWFRLRDAVDQVMAGRSIITAAHGAGFVDAAHFWRSCRATLGMAPSMLSGSGLRFQRLGGECGANGR